ncbi:miniconductance mechanosensitive channel [Izhakiella capsodis]|uniref:Miniconductance mechanosensitive channel n=1 Tax=Izhakiella capsodis TaxID=1367852 RepID=A0A1I4VZA4_9GAMM|nr:mechanosensitive ion channel domain-containing protein [Izhakiella capsodis]SFN06592.1 miniconductance mechanosensitive channel [Izhakiella capsodis]
MSLLSNIWSFIAENYVLYVIFFSGALLVSGLVSWLISKFFLVFLVRRLFFATHKQDVPLEKDVRIAGKLANMVPVITVYTFNQFIPNLPQHMADTLNTICGILFIVYLANLINEILEIINLSWVRKTRKKNHSIKGYIQVGKIGVHVIAAILVLATMSNKSPVIILSSLGAVAAVLMLVFQHTLISLVANIQVSTSDVLQLGDWIEMPGSDISGEVIDIALHTITVRNWDNTISRIPTKNFITETYTNWQAMFASGGRRIKRSFYIDQLSISFATPALIKSLERLPLLYKMVEETLPPNKPDSLDESWFLEQGITNVGLFRKYIARWLGKRGDIRGDMYLVVRPMAPTAQGLPVEVYCFTSSTLWIDYEESQAEIFEYIYAIAHYFQLTIYQQPTGGDFRRLTSE